MDGISVLVVAIGSLAGARGVSRGGRLHQSGAGLECARTLPGRCASARRPQGVLKVYPIGAEGRIQSKD
jgi:hypothetical protein